jgi:hypothetical protein
VSETPGPEARAAFGPAAFQAVAIVHGLGHVTAAIEAARAAGVSHLTLVTARGAPDFAGALWCVELERRAREQAGGLALAFIVDCADRPGRALEALACGASCVALGARADVFARVATIASATGAALIAAAPSGLDFAAVPLPATAALARWQALTRNLD